MRIPASLVLAVVSLALVGCGHVRATGGQPSPVVLSSTAATSGPPADAAARAEPDGEFSLLVFDRVNGQVMASRNPTTPYPAESVVKLLIAVSALQSGADAGVVASMLMRSDDEIANQLWKKYGDTAIVHRAIKVMGLSGTVAPADPGRWGDTQITAEDLVKVYQYLLDKAPATIRDVILKALSSATRYAADGFDQYFGIPDALGDQAWAVKQGWACCRPDRVAHTTGLLGDQQRYIVVALSSHDASTTWDEVTGELTKAVQAAVTGLKF
ncbi:hypothetical protein [Kutzneria sp. CA-103260]|uniref:hypothetical protein n=1 Tax=Kutzneria sp. CA-103260 TaxID=2802641 RepID=UPI001BAC41E3|nr:hypothetical protein [Kutzneria sp. CA-103260]